MTYAETDHPRSRTGQWTDKEHSAPETALAVDLTDEQASEMLANVEEFASYYARRYSMDDQTQDDIVQDTILDVLGQQRRGTEHVLRGNFLNHATRAVASRYIDPNVHHTTLTGRRVMKEKEDQLMQSLGRGLLPGERDRLAEEVRLSFPVGRRPKNGFHDPVRTLSFDMQVGENGNTTLGDLIAAEENEFDGAPTVAAAALDAIEDKKMSVSEGRASAWTLIAPDAPVPAPLSLSDDFEVRERITELGGASAVATAWGYGDLSPEDEATFFSPFGELTTADKESVVTVLSRHRDYSDDLYGAAVLAATDPTSATEAKAKRDEAAAVDYKAKRAAARRESRRRVRDGV